MGTVVLEEKWPAPESRSRPLHAGRCRDSKQVAPGSSQDRINSPGFDATLSISTLRQGFGFTRLHDPHLTLSPLRLSRDAHHPGS